MTLTSIKLMMTFLGGEIDRFQHFRIIEGLAPSQVCKKSVVEVHYNGQSALHLE